MKKRCPKCGCNKLLANAHVVQTWQYIDGEYEETVEDCVEVAHYPDDEDLWTCTSCGYEDSGDKFNYEEPPVAEQNPGIDIAKIIFALSTYETIRRTLDKHHIKPGKLDEVLHLYEVHALGKE